MILYSSQKFNSFRQIFYKDTKNLVCDEKTFRVDLTFLHGLQKKVRSGTMKLVRKLRQIMQIQEVKIMEQKYTVDARGEQCPIPVVKTKKVLDGIQGDAEITVLVDNETAVQNLTRMGKHAGAEVLSEKKSDQDFLVIFRVKDQKPSETQEETVECIPDVRGDFVIAVDTATMGRGNDELGKVLMKGFLFAVTQLEKLPKTMLFYNGGATLTTEDSDSLEDLKSLEAQGVEIKTCGTCLNYYGLTDKLQVGEVTNMYDIVETLAKAAKVVKP